MEAASYPLTSLRYLQGAPAPRLRRLADLLKKLNFLEVQLDALQREGGSHHLRDVGLRIAEAHRRLDGLERELRACAAELGEDAGLPLHELRDLLWTYGDRRGRIVARPPYRGAERRHGSRRASDNPLSC